MEVVQGISSSKDSRKDMVVILMQEMIRIWPKSRYGVLRHDVHKSFAEVGWVSKFLIMFRIEGIVWKYSVPSSHPVSCTNIM